MINTLTLTSESDADERRQWSYSILSAVIEGTTDAIFVKDINGRYIMVNSACARFLNLPAEEIIGKKDFDLYPPETARQFQEQDYQVLSSGETHVFEGIASGSAVEQNYLVTKSVYRDSHGTVIGLIGISHDITDRKRAEEQRIALFREQEVRLIAEESNRLKDEFLATLSHELRTPMSCILGWASLLQSREFDSEVRNQALATIERNARAQMQLINDLLDVSRIINNDKPINLREIDIASVIRAAIESVKLTANAKQIELETHFDNEPITIIGDFNRLQQVVWNLLVNAIKFTPECGRISLNLRCSEGNVEVSISDTGEGIEPEFLPFIFERFRQASQQTTQMHGGLGLGLAIVRHFVELHGGEVRAESPGKGRGAKFTVTIPLITETAESHLAERRKTRSARTNEAAPVIIDRDLNGIRVLMVDNDQDTINLIEAAFNSYGATVTGTSSIQTALEIIRREKFDLLISDIAHNGKADYSLIRQVRALPAADGGKIPAIALTAYARESDRINSYLAGFQLHVSKPVNPLELIAMTVSLTGNSGETQ